MDTLTVRELIDLIGGTKVVMDACRLSEGRISQWRSENYIHPPRLQYLELAFPHVPWHRFQNIRTQPVRKSKKKRKKRVRKVKPT